MGLITLISAAAINLSVLWDPGVWGQIPPCAHWRGKPFTPAGSLSDHHGHAESRGDPRSSGAVTAPMTQMAPGWHRQARAGLCPGQARGSVAPRCISLIRHKDEL